MKRKHRTLKTLLAGCICAASVLCSGFASMAETASASNAAPAVSTNPEDFPTLWVVGDSTAAAFDDTTYYSPRYGWGTQLGSYFQYINIQTWQYLAPAPRASSALTSIRHFYRKWNPATI